MRRHARGMVPTEAGMVLSSHARRVIRQLDAAQADLDEIAGLRRGQVVLGTFPTVASSFLPLVVRRFRQLYPEIPLDIRSAREGPLVGGVGKGTGGPSPVWGYEGGPAGPGGVWAAARVW